MWTHDIQCCSSHVQTPVNVLDSERIKYVNIWFYQAVLCLLYIH